MFVPAERLDSVCQNVKNHSTIGLEKNSLKIPNHLKQQSTRNLIQLFEKINATPKPKPSQELNQNKNVFKFTAESKQKYAPIRLPESGQSKPAASISFKYKVKPSTPAKKKRIKSRGEPNFKFKKIYNYFEKVKARQDEGGGDSEPN